MHERDHRRGSERETRDASATLPGPGKQTLVAQLSAQPAGPGGPAAPVGVPPAASGGTPLPAPVRGQMETMFGASFRDVRVHTGDHVTGLGARAYAQGDDVHFAPGEYNPASDAGRELIGHELAHVVQQRQGRVVPQGKGGINADPALEAEADDLGRRAARDEPVAVQGAAGGATGAVIQRSAVISGQQLAKGPRMDFANDLQQAMPVGNGQHRCHTIAYGTICAGVIDPINACLNAGRDVALGALDGLIRAVYPNGATAGHHVGSVALAGIANQYHTAAVAAANAIANHIAALPQLNLQGIVTEANNLIHALNNSPDNLRVGNGSTNSSIQEGLDLEPIGTSPLPNGAVVVNEDGQQVNPQP